MDIRRLIMRAALWGTLGAVLLPASTCLASELVYAPINPSFIGGNPYNGAWLLSQAQAQDNNKDPESIESSSSDPLSNFKTVLDQQILSLLSQQIITSAFGESGLKSGTYNMGDYKIVVTNTNGINVSITDTTTGKSTTVNVPQY